MKSTHAWKALNESPLPDGERVREAILYVINAGDRLGKRLTQYEILKSFFFADRAHLNKYGRPITFDQYHALKDGPVPSLSYDVLKEAIHALDAVGLDGPLWSKLPTESGKVYYFDAERPASDDVLSESDAEELDLALSEVLKLGFGGVWEKTHADPAYVEAWDMRGAAKRHPMRLSRLLDREDPRRIEDLAFASAHR